MTILYFAEDYHCLKGLVQLDHPVISFWIVLSYSFSDFLLSSSAYFSIMN